MLKILLQIILKKKCKQELAGTGDKKSMDRSCLFARKRLHQA